MEPNDPYVEAFDGFMREWLGRAVRYCSVLCKDPDLAEEIVQAVFVSMFRNRNEPWKAERPAAYLLRAVRNGLIDERKVRRPVSDVQLSGYLAAGEVGEDWSETISRALIGLSDDHREVLSLRYFEDMPLHAIAEVMNRSAGAVNKLLARAKSELRRALVASGEINDFVPDAGGQS